MDEKQTKPRKCRLDIISNTIYNYLTPLFEKYGRYIGNNPWIGIIIGLCLCIIFIGGIYYLRVDNDDEKLFVPLDLPVWDDIDYINEMYGGMVADTGERTVILVIGPNVLKESTLLEIFDLDQEIRSLRTPRNNLSFSEVCFLDPQTSQCSSFNIFLFLNVTSKSAIPFIDFYYYATLFPDFIGGIESDYNNETVTSAVAFRLMYFTQSNVQGREWENFINNFKFQSSDLSIHIFNEEVYKKEVLNLMTQEIPLMIGTACIMVTYIAFILGGKPFVKSKIVLAFFSIVSVGLSLAFALGMCGYTNTPFVMLTPLAVFVLLGVGVDDMIILTDAFAITERKLPVSERLAIAFNKTGFAITLTSVSTAAALGFASLVPWLAIKYFCRTAAFGIIAVYMIHLTFFAGILVLEENRTNDNRYDILFCIKAKIDKTIDTSVKHYNVFRKFLVIYIPKFMSSIWVCWIIVIAFFINTFISCWMTTLLENNVDFITFFSDESRMKKYIQMEREYFVRNKETVQLSFEEMNYNEESVRQSIYSLNNEILNLPFMGYPITSWLQDLDIYTSLNAIILNESNFYNVLQDFLYSPPFAYWNDTLLQNVMITPQQHINHIIFDDINNPPHIIAMRFEYTMSIDSQSKQSYADLSELLKLVKDFPIENTRMVSNWFPHIQRDGTMTERILMQLTMTAIGLSGILIILVHPGISALLILCIFMIDADLLGMMYLWDINLDIAAFIVLSMSIGLAVDYTVHLAYSFYKQSGTAHEKMKASMNHIGISVFNGGLSTFLGICLLSLAKSPSFRIFFKILFGTVFFGLIHGVFFAPSMLQLWYHYRFDVHWKNWMDCSLRFSTNQKDDIELDESESNKNKNNIDTLTTSELKDI